MKNLGWLQRNRPDLLIEVLVEKDFQLIEKNYPNVYNRYRKEYLTPLVLRCLTSGQIITVSGKDYGLDKNKFCRITHEQGVPKIIEIVALRELEHFLNWVETIPEEDIYRMLPATERLTWDILGFFGQELPLEMRV